MKKRLKPIFHLATFFARREAKTRIRQHDWLKLAGKKIRREQVGSVPTFFVCSREQIRLVENRLKPAKLSLLDTILLQNIQILNLNFTCIVYLYKYLMKEFNWFLLLNFRPV